MVNSMPRMSWGFYGVLRGSVTLLTGGGDARVGGVVK